MKNIRLFFSELSCVKFGVFGTAIAQGDGKVYAPTGATIKWQIEHKEITKEQADEYRINGTTIGLGVYLIFSKDWSPVMERATANVRFAASNISWAFYETEAYSSTVNSTDLSHYLQNPSDYVSICALDGLAGQPSGSCTVPNLFPDDWYVQTFDWQQFGWPTFAWGTGFSGGTIDIGKDYAEKQVDGSYKIKLYEIQFKLSPSNTNYRSLPIGFLDDILGHQVIDKSNSNSSIFPTNSQTKLYWPADQSTCPGQTACQDWTDLKQTSYFEFIPGGLFIQNGPDVETFEPSFLS